MHLPSLGKRGGGWVAGQLVLMLAVCASAAWAHSWERRWAFAAYAVGGVLLVCGLGLLIAAAMQLGTALTPFPAPREGHGLTTTGAFSLSRHPMYGGGILIALGWSILFASWVSVAWTVVLAVFLDVKARREELWLVERVPGYDAYRGRRDDG